jgi:oligopeptidase B
MDKSKTKKKPRSPPMVAEIPHKVHEMDGVEVIDNFFWLREKDNPKVLKFLEDENAYPSGKASNTAEYCTYME